MSEGRTVHVLDTGCANVSSVVFALERLGAGVTVGQDAAGLQGAPRVVLPGVGTARAAMRELNARGLAGPLRELRVPLLGLCLGMQLLADASDEGDVPGLGLIPGRVTRLNTAGLPSPHMGWNRSRTGGSPPLFAGLDGAHFYYVHSFALPVMEHTLATCEYGEAFSAAVGHGNFMGVQFHPERSGAAGSRLLQNFLEMENT